MHFKAQSILLATLVYDVSAVPYGSHLGLSKTEDLQSRSGISFSVTATPQNAADFGYTIPIQVGSQSFTVKIDTGSEGFWLLSNQMPASMTGSGHPLYTPGPSATRDTGETFSFTYDDTSGAAGVVYSDNVVIGSATVTGQAVGAATSATPVQTQALSGMLGLDFASIQYGASPNPINTVMKSLFSQLAQYVLALDLRTGTDSTVEFGNTDATKYQGALTVAPRLYQNNANLWYIAPGTYAINGAMATTGPIATKALVDSGTSMIIVSQTIVDAYYKQVPGSENGPSGYIFPCALLTNHQMPSFSIYIQGQAFTVPGSYMWSQHYNATHCFGALEGNTGTTAYFGDMFLRTQYVVYNYTGTGSIGFAAKAKLDTAPTP